MKTHVLESLSNRVSGLESCNFNYLLFIFCKVFLKGRKRSETSPPNLLFLLHILLTDQILLPDFEKLHKIHRKMPVKFLGKPLLQNIYRLLILNQLSIRSQFVRGLQPPFIRHPLHDLVCPLFFKSQFPSPLFCSIPF